MQPNPSALKSAALARAQRAADGDPVVALVLTARQVLPAKAQSFASQLDLAAGTEETEFAAAPADAAVQAGSAAPAQPSDTTPPGGAGPIAPSNAPAPVAPPHGTRTIRQRRTRRREPDVLIRVVAGTGYCHGLSHP